MREATERAKQLNKPLRVAEVGVRHGNNAMEMLTELQIEKLFLVDPYLPYKDAHGEAKLYFRKGPMGWIIEEPMQKQHYFIMFRRMMPFLDKVVFVTQPSVLSSTLFHDSYFDYVYIDGDHTQIEVFADLVNWWPKVMAGGIMAGHDVRMPGVRNSVDQFSSQIGVVPTIGTDDWILIKP